MEKVLMRGIVGFVLFTLISYFLIVLNISVLFIPILLLAILMSIKPIEKSVRQIKIKFDKTTVLTLTVFIFGIIGQMLVISPSGTFKNGDLLFWSSHGHDASWHIALMEEIKKGYPFQNPVFAKEKLVNYHFFSDIAPAIIGKYLPISDLDLYFRIFPFIYSVFFGASAYFLVKRITNSRSASIWATIFTYFAGSFGYIIGKGESVFWATQPQSANENPPQIISDFILMAALYFLFILLQKNGNKLTFWICILLTGTLAEFKVYAAIVLLGALLLAGIWQLFRERKIQILLLTILSGTLAAVLFLPNSSGLGSFLIFQPWWFIRTMIVEPSRLNWIDEELRRQTYVADHNWKRVISIELVGFLIFFFGNLGMRFIGLWDFVKSKVNILKNKFNQIFILIIFISIVLPLLFLQKGVAGNTAQFLQYFILLFGLLAGISTDRLIKLLKYPAIKVLVGFTIIALMVPTQVGLLKDFYGRPAFAKISKAELLALKFLSSNSDKNAVILTAPKNNDLKETGPTPDIWAWADTGYVAAFSGRREYFSDREQVDIMGYNFTAREKIKKSIFSDTDPIVVKNLIKVAGINYLYFPKPLAPNVDLSKVGLSEVFSNREVEIWKTTF